MAVGEWAEAGIDLRNLPYDEVVVEIVVRTGDLPFTLYWQLAETMFADLHDEDVLVQFRLETIEGWQRAAVLAHARGRNDALGVPLLTRA